MSDFADAESVANTIGAVRKILRFWFNQTQGSALPVIYCPQKILKKPFTQGFLSKPSLILFNNAIFNFNIFTQLPPTLSSWVEAPSAAHLKWANR